MILAHIISPLSLTYHNSGQFQNSVANIYIGNYPINLRSKPMYWLAYNDSIKLKPSEEPYV